MQQLSHSEIEEVLLSFKNSWRDYPFDKKTAVYLISKDKEFDSDNMFAVLEEDKVIVRLSLRCDPLLAKILREKYDEVMPGVNLKNDEWNTLVLSGQLSNDDLRGLIRHSYELTKSK
jgi:predicted DNA-binding protein (MmcQ/YjbR family)